MNRKLARPGIPRHHRPVPSLKRVALTSLLIASACRPAASARPAPEPAAAQASTEPPPNIDAPAIEPSSAPPAVAHEPGTIARDAIDRVTARGPGWLLRQLGPEPYRPRGRFEGWRITAVFPDAPEVCSPGCDLLEGDVILSVAGDTLETPDAFAAMFERAPTMQTLKVVRLRAGVRETVDYRIVPQPLPEGAGPG